MVRKQQSKRSTAAKQYKITKKVNEHHRQYAFSDTFLTILLELKKDPGIPNLFPMKEKMLNQIKENRGKCKKLTLKRTCNPVNVSKDMLKKAQARGDAFEELMLEETATASTYEPAAEGRRDNSKKAYYKEFQKVVEMSDVILQVLDARDPSRCRAKQVEEFVMNQGSNKRIILVVNKIDLIPKLVAEKWLKYLRRELPPLLLKHQPNPNVTTFLAQRNSGLKTSITVGVIGFPNVGKSSVINSLKRNKVCTVGSTPGVTKVAQQIHLDKNIKLLDCPGIVFGKVENEEDKWKVLLRNCVKVELVEDPVGAVDFLLSKCKIDQLITLFNIPYCSSSRDFLIHLARKTWQGGIPDLESTARTVIVDWNAGKIPFYTVPPKEEPIGTSAAVLATWSEEFKLTDIVKVETDMLDKAAPKGKVQKAMVALASGDSMDVDVTKESTVDYLYQLDMKGAEAEGDEMDEDDEEDDEDDDEVELPTLMEDSDS
ncbi:P-loop containing nucleoside triphosphate hydrolase protein [Chytridium lagenaria]|nr:P-loop containing nucleoside triphosphate hydrolase protein [Chytridium lagenaria]